MLGHPDLPDCDIVLYVANTTGYHGVANHRQRRVAARGNKVVSEAFITRSDDFAQVALHELGHTFFLGEEYEGGGDLKYPNNSRYKDEQGQPVPVKWADLVEAEQVPTMDATFGGVGAFDLGFSVAGFQPDPNAVARPAYLDIMRDHKAPAYCWVCQRQIVNEMRTKLGAQAAVLPPRESVPPLGFPPRPKVLSPAQGSYQGSSPVKVSWDRQR